jgi:hypothetical protein
MLELMMMVWERQVSTRITMNQDHQKFNGALRDPRVLRMISSSEKTHRRPSLRPPLHRRHQHLGSVLGLN